MLALNSRKKNIRKNYALSKRNELSFNSCDDKPSDQMQKRKEKLCLTKLKITKNFKSEQLPQSNEYYLVTPLKSFNKKENKINNFLNSMKICQIHLDQVLRAIKS
ncbi:unnamed protein product [Moneuplotes crassus]|uniref:Uncharacterized protein n=1 Tax=Euplotes crassus TaxID=5936 RepID=A0AAD1UFC0_EUPCR|nr:unnamed protein product [Moneuplotes crassus]